ncbi:hypothetical protein EVA_14464 [gut metagenome]|uniref:Uncharacterized protein n=1 Tax=gut metagenome TaxID=749906 RepID=J9FR36_9ZZZZ
MVFAIEVVAAHRLAQVHIDHAPGRKYGLLVGIAKLRDDMSDAVDALINGKAFQPLDFVVD